jgi:phosphoribosylanthranilate isomerase
MVLIDVGSATEGFDWSLLSGFDRPYFLAGNLDASNVAEALDCTGAAYVDVSDGIETDGQNDPEKMRAFAQAVRNWDEAHPRLSFLESLHPEYHEEQEGDEELHPELN